MPYLDKDGLTTLWAKVKDTFAPKSHTHTASDLPTATTSARGCVQVGDGLSITSAGVLSATGGGSGAVSGVKGNAESSYRTGNVNLTAANIGAAASSHTHAAGDITSGTISAARGGTGQTTLQATRNAMGLGNTTGALPIANGGTGASTRSGACAALWQSPNVINETSNWNNLDDGIYTVAAGSEFSSNYNAPVGAYKWGTAVVMKADASTTGNGVQIYFPHKGTNAAFYWRRQFSTSATWSAWDAVTSAVSSNLYTNTSGTSGSFTLSSSIANFSVIEVFFKTNDGCMGCQKAYNNYSSSCYLDLTVVHPTSSTTTSYLKFAQLNISGTSASVADIREISLWSSDHESHSSSNAIKITRVVGWKY